MAKTRQKGNLKTRKMAGYMYGCNILTNFENKAVAMTGNGNQVNLQKLIVEKFVKAHQEKLFLAGFSHLKPLWVGT